MVPKFFIHVLNGSSLAEDLEGQDFACLEDARRNALESAGDVLSAEMAAGRYQVDMEFYIHDDDGARLAMLPVTARVAGLG